MTYETGTATDLEDLLEKLDVFATTTHGGWASGYSSNPDTVNGWFELHKGSLSASARYTKVATPATLSLHQATAFLTTGTAPGNHTGDSGNGYNTTSPGSDANYLTERCVSQIGNGPYSSYHFFADDSGPGDYIHVVVQPSVGLYRHFGFGLIEPFGDNWTGGEYVFGQYWNQNTNASPVDTTHRCFFDGIGSTSSDIARSATIRIASGLLNQGAAVYGVSVAATSASIGNDPAGNPRRQIHGGGRYGIEIRGFGHPQGNSSGGHIPLVSIPAYYRDPTAARVQLIGHLPDVRQVSVKNFEPGQEITIGAETWVLFPLSIKTTATVANRSAYAGVAYRKVV